MAAGFVAISAVAAGAADMPLKARPMVASQSTIYVWLDGSYQSLNLPSYDLGFRGVSAGTFRNIGPLETYNPRVHGAGISGAIGFYLPPGSPGRNARIELGGSFISAKASQSGANASVPGGAGAFLVNLNGTVIYSEGCGVVPGCGTTSTLSTDYRSWTLNLKAATDFANGPVTYTPSAQLFGGNSRNEQTLTQQFKNNKASTHERFTPRAQISDGPISVRKLGWMRNSTRSAGCNWVSVALSA